MIQSEVLAQVRRIHVRTNRMVTDVMSGGYTSVFRGSGIEFDEVREFTEGDDIRAVDWNVTARIGRPHVKKYMEERELTVLFLLDLSGSTGFGTSPGQRGEPPTVRKAAATFCACLALAAARNNDKTGLIAFSDRIEGYVPSKKGKAHVLRIIREALALEPQGRGTDLVSALEHAGRVQRKRAVVFVISDFLTTADIGPALRLLARRHDVIAAQIIDKSTLDLPRAGLVHVRDLETGASRWLDSSSARVRQAWAARAGERQAQLAETMRRSGVDRMEIVLRGDLPAHARVDGGFVERAVGDAIVRFFRMRELRGARR
ncbi:MAG: DUF58 domain-containing protein [Planctomycetota bacterium]